MTLIEAVRVAAGSEMNFWTRLEMRGEPTFKRRQDGTRRDKTRQGKTRASSVVEAGAVLSAAVQQ